uniref:RAS guanyl releasing protein 2 (Calcium and DAG-regulated) n=1 Tax=Nothobranchius furzeri TaxID=105023 RepID=A0A8C6Q8Y1_NOTFU
MESISSEQSATVDELLEGCIQAFGQNGTLNDASLVRMFLMMHPWYIPSTDMAKKLVLISQEESCSAERRTRICHLVKYWISEFPAEFNLNPELADQIKDFKDFLTTEGDEHQSQLIDLDSVPSYEWKRQVTQRVPSVSKKRKMSLLFDHLDSCELAEHLTYLEYKSFCKILNSSPTPAPEPKSTMIDEWAISVKPSADPTIIKKHIEKMVESVFKNFDTDGDGHISRDEFEAIRNNFPYLSKFGELDKNRDGKISRDEMIDYFLKASSLLNCKMGFVHTFTETTYVKPTFCEHCAGFIWGFYKQGYKCKGNTTIQRADIFVSTGRLQPPEIN